MFKQIGYPGTESLGKQVLHILPFAVYLNDGLRVCFFNAQAKEPGQRHQDERDDTATIAWRLATVLSGDRIA